LRVFEVDHPATQAWKRWLAQESGLPACDGVQSIPVDFERQSLADELAAAGLDAMQPTMFAWLGVVLYLTPAAFRGTVEWIAGFPERSGVVMDYALPRNALPEEEVEGRDLLAARVKSIGEPFQLFFRSERMENELKSAGFGRIEQVDSVDLNARYFAGRTDGLRLPDEGLGKLAVAWA